MLYLLSYFVSVTNIVPDYERCCPIGLSTNEFDVSYETKYFKMYFEPIKYDEESSMLSINSKVEIQYIEISRRDDSDDVHPWTLVVYSDKVQLSKLFFKGANSKLKFYLEDKSDTFEIYLDFKLNSQ